MSNSLFVSMYGNVDLNADTFSYLVDESNLEKAIQTAKQDLTELAHLCMSNSAEWEDFVVTINKRDDKISVELVVEGNRVIEWHVFQPVSVRTF